MTENQASQPAGETRLNKVLRAAVSVVALAMILYHVLIVWHPMFGEMMNQNAHLGFCLILLCLSWALNADKTWKRAVFLLSIPVCLTLIIYMAVEYERLTFEAGFPEPRDVVIGVIMITYVIWYTWRAFGPIFPTLVLIALGYSFFGHHIPGVMNHPEFEFGYVISNLSVGFQGVYGMLLGVSVNILFLLVIFGSAFDATGVTRFFMEVGVWLSRRLPGGAGHTAVFSSSLVGMVNGAAVANVAITGSYTIPVMKKSGFTGEQAGAIEAMASTGGQLTPPIMGIAVFIMATFLGVSYADLMFKAILPAAFYYAIAIIGVILIAKRDGIPRGTGRVNPKAFWEGAPIFFIPMGILTTILVLHYSVGYAAFFATVSLLLVSSLRSQTRPSLPVLIRCLVAGAVMAATFGVATGCIGILIKSMTFTGAATKLSLLISLLSEGRILPALVMTMLLSILLSTSTPSVIAYIIVAFMAAPILTEMGVRKVAAHFFVYYFAILAAVTPPIAGGAIVGSQIAGAKYMKTAWEGFKLAGPFFLLPFFIVNNPVLFLEKQDFLQAFMALGALVMALGSMVCYFQSYCLTPIGFRERAVLLVTSMLAVWHGLYGQPVFFIIPLILSTGFLMHQWFKRRKTNVVEASALTSSGGETRLLHGKESNS